MITMTLDAIIEKYGTHELDVYFVKNDAPTVVFAYCHQHDLNGQFMVNHYLKIQGKFSALEMDTGNEADVYIHIAYIEKDCDGSYEISGVGGNIRFCVEDELLVEEISEDEYSSELEIE